MQRNRGVPGARDIENLAGAGRRVIRGFAALEQNHTVFTQGHQQGREIPFFQKNAADFDKGGIR